MKTINKSIYIGLLLWVSAACTTNPINNTAATTVSSGPLEPSGPLDIGPVDVGVGGGLLPNSMPYVVGTWHGVIPCINCPGITYDLLLNEDNTFEETRVYQNRDTGATIRTGTWRITEEGVLELNNRDAEPTRFDLSTAGELNMLDESGNPIETPIADMYRLRREPELTETDTQLWTGRVGVDFVATGNEPGWLLEIDLEEGMYFKTRPSETVSLSAPLPAPATEGSTTRYFAQTEDGELVVELTETPCTDSMSGSMLPYTVQVVAKGERFVGCGKYLGEAGR
ncbi:copper resistance protein NlpE N-terminal domain-containing protein [Pontibacter pamirensis]|uniref:copper resistance protein NlpE N-terminal domain-containing protein n=1 Tax=Pontibacter pamirensis TaxID=2562824 RepID=UPI00138A4B55|nr:copper resistance protein NlpE N-terminal domain-containing protein [Pontibacter pamirensis]